MNVFPRLPDAKEKEDIAAIVFPEKKLSEVDFDGVWLLAPLYNDLEFNCMGWSILENQTIPIPDKIANINYLAGNARKKYHAPFDYVPTTYDAPDAAIRVWGNGHDDIMHISRICTKDILKDYAIRQFQVKLNFDSPGAKGFPEETWSSKYGDRNAFTTHPRDWLKDSVWGVGVEDLKIKQ